MLFPNRFRPPHTDSHPVPKSKLTLFTSVVHHDPQDPSSRKLICLVVSPCRFYILLPLKRRVTINSKLSFVAHELNEARKQLSLVEQIDGPAMTLIAKPKIIDVSDVSPIVRLIR